jgi:hypothetical protein
LLHDLILLTDIPLIVQTASVRHGLNKAQTKALAKFVQAPDNVFYEITTQNKIAVMTRLGIPQVRIAQRLNIHRETI